MKDFVNESRLTQLKELLAILADSIDQQPGARDMAQLSRQYRETLREIEELETMTDDSDDIGQLLSERELTGKPGAIRQSVPRV